MVADSRNVIFLLMFAICAQKDICLGAKLERKQDFFEVESFDNKREYGLSEIGKRGFSTLGFDYSSSAEYGIGATSVVSPDYSGIRSSGSDEAISSSPPRDLIPPPPFSSSTSPPTSRTDYSKFSRIPSASSSPTKDFLSPRHHHHRSQISRRSPPHLHHHQPSLSHYFDEINNIPGGGIRGRVNSHGSFGLVADNDGKLIGYRGSILPGYSESPPIVSTTSSISPDPSNFIGGYFPGPSSIPDYNKSKFSTLASSASSGSYTSTPVYYPGREEDHTYRMRDATSQGYDDDEQNPSSEDNDFTVGSSGTYQPSPLPQPPSPPPPHHYHLRENEGILGHGHLMETASFIPYGRDHSPPLPGFQYEPLGKNHRLSYDYNAKRSFGPPSTSPSAFEAHNSNSVERGPSPPFGYMGLSYNDYGSS